MVPGAARYWTGAAALDGMVCLVASGWGDGWGGGWGDSDQGQDMACWLADEARWVSREGVPSPRSEPGVAALDGRLHVVGGERFDGSPPSHVLHHAWTPNAVLQVFRKD